MTRLPTFYIPHGGGPCFDIAWPSAMQGGIDSLGDWLSRLPDFVGVRPEAILIVTAHWETDVFTVDTSAAPGMIYDYTGFPAHTYQLRYDAPGNPVLAGKIAGRIAAAGIAVKTESRKGFDHGTFVPLRKIYPQADIPVIQLSILKGWDPAAHRALGEALAPLREQGVLILGSGMSYHNFSGFNTAQGTKDSMVFDEWLTKAVETTPDKRNEKLSGWSQAPAGRSAHPEEDHLIPLMVIAGAAGEDAGKAIYTGNILGVTVSGYQFGASAV